MYEIEIENKNIDGEDYACAMMPATMAHKVLVRLVEIVGRPALAAIATGVGTKRFGDVRVDHMSDVATGILFQNLTPDTADEICKQLMTGVMGEDVGDLTNTKVFDEHFKGRLLHMYKVSVWSIQVNYRDFANELSNNSSLSDLFSVVKSYAKALITTAEKKDEEKEKVTKEASKEPLSPLPNDKKRD